MKEDHGPAPIVQIDKIENNTYNHVDSAEIISRLKRIERKVVEDTEAEETLAAQNEELREQIEELLTGETLPPAVKEKLGATVLKIKQSREALTKAVEDNTTSQ